MWQTLTAGNCNNVFWVDTDTIYLTTIDNGMFLQALDRATGAIKWTTPLNTAAYVTAGIEESHAVMIGYDGGGIDLFDSVTGALFTAKPPLVKGDAIYTSPVLLNSTLFILSGRYITAVNVKTWKVDFDHLMTSRITAWYFDNELGEVLTCAEGTVDVNVVRTGKSFNIFNSNNMVGDCHSVLKVSSDHVLIGAGSVSLVNRNTKAVRWTFIDSTTTNRITYVPRTPGVFDGHGLVVVPNSASAGGWPIEALLCLDVNIDGVYFNVNTVYSPYSLQLNNDGSVVFAFDTNNMYGVNVVDGTFNWTWQYPFSDAMQTAPGMVYQNGYVAASTEFVLVVVNATSGTLVTRINRGASNGVNIKTLGSQYILYGNDDEVVVVDVSDNNTVFSYQIMDVTSFPDETVVYVQPVTDTEFAAILVDGEESGGTLVYYRLEHSNTSGQMWSYNWSNQHVTCPPIAIGPLVITGAGDFYAYAFERETGKVAWRSPLLKEPPYHAIVSKEGLFVLTPSYVHRISRRTGKVLWTSPSAPGMQSHPHIANGILIARGQSIMYAFNLTQGDILWSWSPPGGDSAGSFGAFASVIDDVFITGMSSTMMGFSFLTGQILFTSDFQGACAGTTISNGIGLVNSVPTDVGDNAIFGIQIPTSILNR